MTERDLDTSELERLFVRGHLSRRQFVQALGAIGISLGGIEGMVGHLSGTLPAEAASAPPRYLVLIVLDAFRPDYMTLAPMPALAALIQTGVSYDRAWVAQLESETPTGHATLSTGSLPKDDGILGFEWRDPKTRQEVLDGWPPAVLKGLMERDLRASGAASIPHAVKQANPKATVVALSSEKVYAADAMGGWAADYILHHQRSPTNRGILNPAAVPGHQPPPEFFQHPGLQMHLPLRHFTDWDYFSTMLALAAFAEFRPEVLMVNLPGADVYGHPYGGPATPTVFREVVAGLDRNIGRIVQAYQQAGIYDQTLFVVTADHGMVPNDRAVDGSATKQAVLQAGGQYLFHTGGTAADVYLHNWWHARAVAEEMLRVPNVGAAYYQVDRKGQYEYLPAPGLNIDPALDDAYQYLLSTFSGSRAPDVVAPFRENTVGELVKSAHGDHGGLNWGAQHVPLVLSGPGVASGITSHFPARLMDVAPTVLRIMGLPPAAMDGKVLADAITSATGGEVADQQALAAPLTAHQDALMSAATSNIAEDLKEGLHPPPSLPLRP